MFRNLLAERFQVVLHRENKPIPGFALTVAWSAGRFGAEPTILMALKKGGIAS
jgi:uncharacterized protein (TIGR03435 family)